MSFRASELPSLEEPWKLGSVEAWKVGIMTGIVCLSGAAAAQEPTTRVHIDSRSPVSLYRIDHRGEVVTVCSGACGETAPMNGLYWIAGRDVNASGKFLLPGGRPDTKLFVSGGNKGTMTAGVVLAIAGANLVIWVGLSAVIFGALAGASRDQGVKDLAPPLYAIGVTTNAVGLVLGVVGLAMWLSNTSATIESTAKNFVAPSFRF